MTSYIFLSEEAPSYVTSEERIVEIHGEALKVLKALEAVIAHLRKFLVDHSVVPVFEKTVSLLRSPWFAIVCCNCRIMNNLCFVAVQCNNFPGTLC